MAEDALRTVLTTVEALDADTCDYLVAGLLAAAEDEPGRVLTTELAAEFAAPFLDNVPESDAAALYLRLVAASTSDTGVCEATAQAESAGAQAARLAQLGLGEGAGAASSAHAPQLPKARGGGLRIGQLQVLRQDISEPLGQAGTRSDGSSAVNDLIEGETDRDAGLPLALAQSRANDVRSKGRQARQGTKTASVGGSSDAGSRVSRSALSKSRALVLPLQRLAWAAAAISTGPAAALPTDLLQLVAACLPRKRAASEKPIAERLLRQHWAWRCAQLPSWYAPSNGTGASDHTAVQVESALITMHD